MIVYPYRVLVDGCVVSLVLTIYIIGTLRWNYRWWLADFPPDLQASLPPQTANEKQKGGLIGLGAFAIVLLGMAVSFILLKRQTPTEITFFSAWLHAFLFFQVFNACDLLVIDWIGCLFIDPSKPPIPGTENSPGYRDYFFHVIGFLKGIVIGIFVSLLPAIVVSF